MKRTLALIAFIAGAFTTNAQILWKISGNGLEKASYILGTHHAAPGNVCDKIAGFDAAYSSIDQIYGEVETDVMNATSTQMEMMKYAMMPEGRTLSSLYTADEIAKINAFITPIVGADLTAFENLKPVTLISTLQMLLAMKVIPEFNPATAVDSYMQDMAKKDNKATLGLETVEFQMDLLYNAPLEEQAEDLLEMAEDGSKTEETIIKLTEHYLEQNIEGLWQIMLEDSEPGELDDLVYNRNRNWIGQMKQIMPEKPTMFVVGAGHLPGELGVLNLLKKEGFKVEPVW